MRNLVIASVLTAAGLYGRKRLLRDSPPLRPPPGGPKRLEARVLGAGAALLQDHAPLTAMNAYLNAFHFESGDLGHQMEAHHYCARLTDDFIQCTIFDGNTPDARLIGVEYIISARLFQELPDDERPFWHSHAYEVTSGMLIAPGIPELVEHRLMDQIAGTYGKTWHTWRDLSAPLPLGIPALMMGFTADGQLHPNLLVERDERMGVSSEARRENRRDITPPPPIEGADAWEHGRVMKIRAEEERGPGR